MCVWGRANIYTTFLVGQASREIPLGRPGHRFDYCDSGQNQDRTDSCVPGNQIAGSIKNREFLK